MTPNGTLSRSLSLAGADYPADAPLIVSTTGGFVANDLYLDATIDNVISWNSFSDFSRQTRDRIALILNSLTFTLSPDRTSITIPAYSLPTDFYSPLAGELQFIKNREYIDPTPEMRSGRAGKLKFTDFGVLTFPAPVLTINSVTHLPNGHVRITGTTAANHLLSVRASRDMVQPFRILPIIGTAMSDGSGLFVFEDDQPGLKRFYRATMP